MNERTPKETSGSAVPNPHAGEPAPPPEEGLRPEADPAVVRPTQEEPGGPVGGLFKTAGAEAAAHYTRNPRAEATALAATVGVEEEGIEAGELFGLMLATVVAIVMLGLTIYYLFYSPALEETREHAADVPADRYIELRDVQAAGVGLLGDYAVNPDSTYRLPIDAAMRLVVQDYAGAGAEGAPGAAARDPRAFAEARYNGLTWLTLNPPPAVRSAGEEGTAPAAVPDTAATPARGVLEAPNPVTPPEAPTEAR